MKKFNEQTGNEFEKYMSRLKDDRDRNGFETNYAETNRKLVSEYHKTSDSKKKLEIRNKLVMFNIKLAHEILYKKLNVDISKENSVDILQEINLCLVESVDKVLETKKEVAKTLFYLIIGSLDKIIKKYYDYSSKREFILEPDEIIEDEKEEKVDVRIYINERILKTQEYHILKEFLNDDVSLELIGCKYGLTSTRIGQIKSSAIKRIKDAIEDIKWWNSHEHRTKEKIKILEFLKTHPNIKYIIKYPNIEDGFFKSYTNQSLLEKLIYKGIDLKEWLIVDDKPREYYVKELGCKKINHLLAPTIYYDSFRDLIYDRNLNKVSEFDPKLFNMESYYNFLFEVSEFSEDGVIRTLGRNYITEYLINDPIAGECRKELEKYGHNKWFVKDYKERKSYLLNNELARRAIIKVYLTKL